MAFEILARLGLNATGFQSGLKRAESAGVTFSRSLRNQIAGAFTIGAIVQFTRKTIEAGGAIQDTSDRLGISTKRVQELAFAAKQTGSDINGVNIAYGELAQSIELAKAAGGGKDAGAFAALGVSAEDLKSLNVDQIFEKIASRMKGVTNGSREMAVASEIFGRGWRGILPLLVQGFNDLAAAAPIMADPTVKALDDIGNALDRLKEESIVGFAPALVAIFNHVSMQASWAQRDIARLTAYIKTVKDLAGATNPDGSEMTGLQIAEAASAAAEKADLEIREKRFRAKINALERELIEKGDPLPEMDAVEKAAKSAPNTQRFQQEISSLQRIGEQILGGGGNNIQRDQLMELREIKRGVKELSNGTVFP